MNINRKSLIVVMVVALVLNLGVAFMMGLNRPMESDSYYFLCIAKSLATGHGYMLKEGFWPDVPTISRAPGWPFVISIVLRVFPGVNADLLMRLLACTLNSLAAVLVAVVAGKVIRYSLFVIGSNNNKELITNNLSALAGIIYAVYPVALYEAYEGTSEILFVVLVLAGTLPIISAKQSMVLNWRLLIGFLIMGCAVLVRPNFITWIGFAVLLVIGYRLSVRLSPSPFRGEGWGEGGGEGAPRRPARPLALQNTEETMALVDGGPPASAASSVFQRVATRKMPPFSRSVVCGLWSMVLFLTPPALWAARNYHVCGNFPVLSTLRGQTFYGGNNSVVANTWQWWGYWVFPNSIPGEPTLYSMSRTMSEQEVDVYYFGKGKEWVKTHLNQMPRLVLGKLVRAYVPVPWKLSAKSAVVAGFRIVIYLAGFLGLLLMWRRMGAELKIILIAMALSNVLTVVMFWGCARFAFELDPFLIAMSVGVFPFVRGKSC